MSNLAKQRRVFSVDFKVDIVKQLEQKQVSVAQIVKAYQVAESVVYKWLKKYGTAWQPTTTTVVQLQSEALKTIQLQQEIQGLKLAFAEKTIHCDLLEHLLILFQKEHGFDLKKSTSGTYSMIFIKTSQHIPIPSGLYYKLLESLNKASINTNKSLKISA